MGGKKTVQADQTSSRFLHVCCMRLQQLLLAFAQLFNGGHHGVPAIASEPTHLPALQAELVERFVVVHGQIILNQFKNFPKKSVANSAFVSGLKGKLELRRHCKLYAVPRPKAHVRVRCLPCPSSTSYIRLVLRLLLLPLPKPEKVTQDEHTARRLCGADTALELSPASYARPHV